MRKHRKLILKLIFVTGILGLILGLGGFVFPVELKELLNRYRYYRAGIVSVEIQGWHSYLIDQCQKHPGEGCSCVAFVHGLGDNAITWKKIFLWPEQKWRTMGMDHSLKLLAVDLPGSGLTAAPKDLSEYRVRKEAEKLRSILASLCPQWVVVGNSMGGWVATWLALDWPEGIRRLMLLDSAGLKKGSEANQDLLVKPSLESMKEFQKRAYYRPRFIPDWEWRVVLERIKMSHVSQIWQAQTEEDYLDTRLPALRRPTLLAWGKEDQVIPLSVGQQMRELIPGVLWREFPECGHLPQKECPLPVIQGIIDIVHYGAM